MLFVYVWEWIDKCGWMYDGDFLVLVDGVVLIECNGWIFCIFFDELIDID